MFFTAWIFSVAVNAWAIIPSPCEWTGSGLWAKNLEVNPIKTQFGRELISQFMDSPILYLRSSQPIHRNFGFQENSVFGRKPEILDLIEDFESWNTGSVLIYRAELQGLEKATMQIADWSAWYQFKKEIYQAFKSKLLLQIPSEQIVHLVLLLRNFEKRVEFLESWVVDPRMLSRMEKGAIEYIVGLKGVLGEVKALLSLEQVYSVNQRLSEIDFLQAANIDTFRNVFLKYAKDPEGLLQFSLRYPYVFQNPHFTVSEMYYELRNPDFVDAFVETVATRIASRGIDLKGVRTEKYGYFSRIIDFTDFLKMKLKSDPAQYLEFYQDRYIHKFMEPIQFPKSEIPLRMKTPDRILMYLVEMRDLNLAEREFDGYSEQDGKRSILEIKNTRVLALNPKLLSVDQNKVLEKAKNQVRATLQILEFLGVRDQIQYQYFSLEGLHPLYRKELLEQGVVVHSIP